jgi:hypothetical protein
LSCFQCNASDEEKPLRKCPICYRYFCNDCGVNRSGRWFCTGICGDYFFFGEDEDEMEE